MAAMFCRFCLCEAEYILLYVLVAVKQKPFQPVLLVLSTPQEDKCVTVYENFMNVYVELLKITFHTFHRNREYRCRLLHCHELNALKRVGNNIKKHTIFVTFLKHYKFLKH